MNAADTVIDAVRRVEFGPLTFWNLGLLRRTSSKQRQNAHRRTADLILEAFQ